MISELLRRPILVGGLGLTAGAWLLHGVDPTVAHFGGTAVWVAIAAGSGFWWLKQQTSQTAPAPIVVRPVDQTLVEQAFATVEARIAQLVKELDVPEGTPEPAIVEPLRQQLDHLKGQTQRQALKLAVLGGQAAGKTTLTQRLQLESSTSDSAQLTESTLRSETEQANASNDVSNADLILFVTTGDLTDSEFQTIQTLIQQHYRILLIFNKQDQYLPADRAVILQQLRDRVQGLIAPEDVVATIAQPAAVKVRQHQPDGTIQERIEQPEPEMAALQERLQQVLTTQVQPLILATVYRQAQDLLRAVQTELNQVRRTRALPIIEQYQWIAAAAAFANPVPSLDLVATATINAQMVMDLGTLYQQRFSLEQAKTVAGNLGSQMVQLGLVELASQAITPLLKSHALTYVAGGTLQGISAAYLTRLAGLSLVEYFEEQSQTAEPSSFQLDRLVQKLKLVFNDNQRTAFLQNLVKQGIGRLAPQASASA